MLEEVLLVGPVEEEDQSLPEVELVVKVGVVVDETIDQVLWVQHLWLLVVSAVRF